MNIKVIKKTGAFYTFKHNDEILVKAQGKEQLWKSFTDNEKAFEKLQSSLVFKQDEKVKMEYQNDPDELPDEMDDMLSNIAENFIEKQDKKGEKKEDSDGD